MMASSYLPAMSLDATSDEPPGSLYFERVLLPHRSLPPRGFHLLMGLLGLISLAVGIGFVSIGAWPICGFFGLDVAALYLAFRLSYRSARQREVLRLAGDDFTVERIDIYGERRRCGGFSRSGCASSSKSARMNRTGSSSPRTARAS